MTLYNQIRHEIKTGDLIEWRSNSIVGRTIRLFTGKAVNHTGIAFVMDNYGGISGRHIFTLEAAPKGIECNLLSVQLQNFKGQVFLKQLKPQFDHLRNIGIDWALEQTNTKYDYGSLFKNIFGKVSADARKFFCSEYVFIYLVICTIIKKNIYDTVMKKVYDMKSGKEIKAPRPGEFDQFSICNKDKRIK